MRRFAAAGLVLALTAASSLALAAPTVPTPGTSATYMASLQLPTAGWAKTVGGRGGRIIRVTTLAASGPGSLREALEATGPRIVVFEVAGQIDMGTATLDIKNPFVTIAGQTAPSPGVTLIRGKGLAIHTHDVIVQHIRVRTGDAGHPRGSGWSTDGVRTEDGAYDVIIDHCSLYWATNKIAAVAGTRFGGATPDDWRNTTSHRVTFSNTIIAEALSRSSHWKIEHSKGALIHDNTTGVLLLGDLFAHDYERSPLFKGGVHGAIVNNLIYDPGQRAIHYNLIAEEWGPHPYQVGMMSAVGNVLRAGMSTPPDLAFLEIGGDGDLEYYGHDNIAVDRIGRPLPMLGAYTTTGARIIEEDRPPVWPEGLVAIPARDVQRAVLATVGARPWDRDYDDARLVADVAEGRGWIIDSEADVHGNLPEKQTRRPFHEADWDLATMTPKSAELLDASDASTTLMEPEVR
jgi:pectate lyase